MINKDIGSNTKTELVSCDLCGSDSYKTVFVGSDLRHPAPGEYRMVECAACGLLYVNPRPSEEAISSHYPTDYAPYHSGGRWLESITRMLRKREASRIAERLPKSARVLEIGCAAGDLLLHLKNAGLDATGVEMSPFAAEAAREQGLNVHTGVLASAPLAKNDYDAVVMRAVIPHLPSPNTELGLVASFLKHGGLLFITIENAASLERRVFGRDWYGYDIPRHLNLFTPSTVKKLLELHDMKVVRFAFSMAPNYWVGSMNFMLGRWGVEGFLRKTISIKNPALLASFLPITAVQKLVGASSRLSVIAQKQAR